VGYALRPDANLGAGSWAGVWELIVQDARCGPRGKATPLGHQETIGGYAECGVMMKATPSSSLEVAQAKFLFQLFIIAFDDPALFRLSD